MSDWREVGTLEELDRRGRLIVELDGRQIGIFRHPSSPEELLAIRNGAWDYDFLIQWAEEKDAELGELVKITQLPHHPDRVALDRLCRKVVESHFSIGRDTENS